MKTSLRNFSFLLAFSLVLFSGCADKDQDANGAKPELDFDYIAGKSYFGRNRYIEYRAGNLPIIIGAPHGGYEKPDEIPDRTWGNVVKDAYTLELVWILGDSLSARTGKFAHLIICHLHRIKLDVNRDMQEAAQGNRYAGIAWGEYHDFIVAAKESVTEEHGQGLFMDLHGQSQRPQIELGYLLDGEDLVLPDSILNGATYVNKSSLRALAEISEAEFSAIVRGPASLGSLISEGGYPVVPSAEKPDPAGEGYFRGGYSTRRHGSRDGGTISGVQLEAHKEGVRDTKENRALFSAVVTESLLSFFREHYGMDLENK